MVNNSRELSRTTVSGDRKMSALVDIIVPVHNALDAVLDLFTSLDRFTQRPYRVIVVDDCSDPHVSHVISEQCKKLENYQYQKNGTNIGYVKSVNLGLDFSDAPYVCILNSDTVVTSNWLQDLLLTAERDDSIAVLNPITNFAVQLAVPLPPGFSIHMMAERLQSINKNTEAFDIVAASGYCFFIPRKFLKQFGLFDEIYSPGYCEETDYCMRVKSAGFRVATAPKCLVFHRGRASFGHERRTELMINNWKIFDERWRILHRKLVAQFLLEDPISIVRSKLFEGLSPIGSWPYYIRTQINRLKLGVTLIARGEIKEFVNGVINFATKLYTNPGTEPGLGIRPRIGLRSGLFSSTQWDRLSQTTFIPTEKYVQNLPRNSQRMRIVFLVDRLAHCGGATDIVQMVNQLALQGHDPIIVTLDQTCSATYATRLLTRPLVFRNLDHLVEAFPQSNVVVATFWPTAYYWYPRLAQRYDFLGAYYVQDFEPFFYPDGSEEYKKAMVTYSLDVNVIAISDWIKGKLAELGQPATLIPIGMDLGIFYPRRAFRPKAPGDEFILTAMVRPITPRRGFQTLVKTCEILHSQDPRIRFKFFGCDSSAFEGISFPWESVGLIENPERMAEHLSSCDLLVDPSDFQGFGRCGLEAMACGLPTVLTNEGGTREYGVHGENTLMARAKDSEDFARRVLQIRRDPRLQESLSRRSLDTAKKFCHRKIGQQQSEYFQSLVSKRYCSRTKSHILVQPALERKATTSRPGSDRWVLDSVEQ